MYILGPGGGGGGSIKYKALHHANPTVTSSEQVMFLWQKTGNTDRVKM
jgi:hypothetical protein